MQHGHSLICLAADPFCMTRAVARSVDARSAHTHTHTGAPVHEDNGHLLDVEAVRLRPHRHLHLERVAAAAAGAHASSGQLVRTLQSPVSGRARRARAPSSTSRPGANRLARPAGRTGGRRHRAQTRQQAGEAGPAVARQGSGSPHEAQRDTV